VGRKNMGQRRVSAHLINARCNRTGFRQSNAFAQTAALAASLGQASPVIDWVTPRAKFQVSS